MQNIEDTIDQILKLMDHHWDAQSWRDLTGFEYAKAVCLRTEIDRISNLLKRERGWGLEIAGKDKMILENYVLWYDSLFNAGCLDAK